MLELLAIVIVLASAFGLGWLLLVCLVGRQKPVAVNGLEISFLSLTLGILVLGWMALVLAEAGLFSLGTLIVLLGISVSVLVFVLRRRVFMVRIIPIKVGWPEWVALGIWLVAACYLFFRPPTPAAS
jgi:hypothetical protein